MRAPSHQEVAGGLWKNKGVLVDCEITPAGPPRTSTQLAVMPPLGRGPVGEVLAFQGRGRSEAAALGQRWC